MWNYIAVYKVSLEYVVISVGIWSQIFFVFGRKKGIFSFSLWFRPKMILCFSAENKTLFSVGLYCVGWSVRLSVLLSDCLSVIYKQHY